MKKNIYFFVEGHELQKFQDYLLEGLVATLSERSKDGNLVGNVSLIYCNMQDTLEK